MPSKQLTRLGMNRGPLLVILQVSGTDASEEDPSDPVRFLSRASEDPVHSDTSRRCLIRLRSGQSPTPWPLCGALRAIPEQLLQCGRGTTSWGEYPEEECLSNQGIRGIQRKTKTSV